MKHQNQGIQSRRLSAVASAKRPKKEFGLPALVGLTSMLLTLTAFNVTANEPAPEEPVQRPMPIVSSNGCRCFDEQGEINEETKIVHCMCGNLECVVTTGKSQNPALFCQ